MSRVESKQFADPKVRTNPVLEKKIEVLEQGTDPKSVFDKNELRELEDMGRDEYLAYLLRARQSLAEENNW